MEEQKPISALRKRANELRNAKTAVEREQKVAELNGIIAIERDLLADFKLSFAEVLPLLKEEGISYEAHRGEPSYEDSYILFKKDGKELKMDYIGKKQYRYEHPWERSPRYGQLVFGDWLNYEEHPMGGPDYFILWIADNLLNESVDDPTPQQRVNDIAANYEPFFLNKAWATEQGYPPTISFHSLLWSILVGQVYKDKLVCLTPNLSGQFGKSVSIVVVFANEAGHEPVNVLFDPKYSFSEAWDVLDEINEQLWEVSSPQLSRYIVTTSMAAEAKQPTQEEFEGTSPAFEEAKKLWRETVNLNFKQGVDEFGMQSLREEFRERFKEMHIQGDLDEGEMGHLIKNLLGKYSVDIVRSIGNKAIYDELLNIAKKRLTDES